MLCVVSIFSGLQLNSSGFVDGVGGLDHVPTAESTLILKSPAIIVL